MVLACKGALVQIRQWPLTIDWCNRAVTKLKFIVGVGVQWKISRRKVNRQSKGSLKIVYARLD